MSSHFLIVTLDLKAPFDEAELKATLDVAIDWVQYMPKSFLLKTTSDPGQWYTRLKRVFGAENQFFISKLDLSERQGWMAEWVWEWIMKNESTVKQPDSPQRQTEQERASRPDEVYAPI